MVPLWVVSRVSGTVTLRGVAPGSRLAPARPFLIDLGLQIARIDAHQHVAGLHLLVVVHRHFQHAAVDFGGDRDNVAIHLRVVGGDAVAIVQPRTRRPPAPRSSLRRGPPARPWIAASRPRARCSPAGCSATGSPLPSSEFPYYLLSRLTWCRQLPFVRWRGPGRRAPGCSGRAPRSGYRSRGPARPARVMTSILFATPAWNRSRACVTSSLARLTAWLATSTSLRAAASCAMAVLHLQRDLVALLLLLLRILCAVPDRRGRAGRRCGRR